MQADRRTHVAAVRAILSRNACEYNPAPPMGPSDVMLGPAETVDLANWWLSNTSTTRPEALAYWDDFETVANELCIAAEQRGVDSTPIRQLQGKVFAWRVGREEVGALADAIISAADRCVERVLTIAAIPQGGHLRAAERGGFNWVDDGVYAAQAAVEACTTLHWKMRDAASLLTVEQRGKRFSQRILFALFDMPECLRELHRMNEIARLHQPPVYVVRLWRQASKGSISIGPVTSASAHEGAFALAAHLVRALSLDSTLARLDRCIDRFRRTENDQRAVQWLSRLVRLWEKLIEGGIFPKNEVTQLARLDLDAEADRVREAMECLENDHSTNRPLVTPTPSHPTHSDDYRSVRWCGVLHVFTATQAACIKVLWENWQRGTPVVGEQTILERVDSSGDRLRDVFDKGKHAAWESMIISAGKGAYRLADCASDSGVPAKPQ